MTTALLTPPEAPGLCRRSRERSLHHRGNPRDQGSPARNPQLSPSGPLEGGQAGGRRGGNDRISLRILGHSLATSLPHCLPVCSQGGQLPVPLAQPGHLQKVCAFSATQQGCRRGQAPICASTNLGEASLPRTHAGAQDPRVHSKWTSVLHPFHTQVAHLLQSAPSDPNSRVVGLMQRCPRAPTQWHPVDAHSLTQHSPIPGGLSWLPWVAVAPCQESAALFG